MQARIHQLWRYPVKGCAGESLQDLALDAQGWPVGDRGWAVMDAQGEAVGLDRQPRLTWVQARALEGGGVHLEARDGSRCTLPGHAGANVPLRVWNEVQRRHETVSVQDGGDAAAELLERVTGSALRLVRLPEAVRRREGTQALHLVSESSLEAWRQAQPGLHMAARRLRANVVLGCAPEEALPAFVEERLRTLDAPQARLHGLAPCLRCAIPSVDPATAQRDDALVASLAQLSAARAPGAPVRFGVYLQGEAEGRLRVGDAVVLTLR